MLREVLRQNKKDLDENEMTQNNEKRSIKIRWDKTRNGNYTKETQKRIE